MDLQQDASVNLTGYSSASYSKGGQYNGGGGYTPMYDNYGNPIPGGRDGPYNGVTNSIIYSFLEVRCCPENKLGRSEPFGIV